MSTITRLRSTDSWTTLWRTLDEANADTCLILFCDQSAKDQLLAFKVYADSVDRRSELRHYLVDVREQPIVLEQAKKDLERDIIPPVLVVLGTERRVLVALNGPEISAESIVTLVSRDDLSVDEVRFPANLVSGDIPAIDIVVRELVQNAADACDRMRHIDPSMKPEIQVELTLGSDGRHRLRISDSGEGMTHDTLSRKLLRLGASGTAEFDAKHPALNSRGTYGYGFVTCLSISDRVEVRSQSYGGSADGVTWIWNRTGRSSTFRSPPSPRNGSSVTLTLKTAISDKLDTRKIKQIIARYTRFVPVPIYWGKSAELCNNLQPPWTQNAPDIKTLQVFCRLLGENNPLHLIPISLSADLPFKGLLFVPSKHEAYDNSGERRAERIDLYVKGIFVCELHSEQVGPYEGLVGGVLCDDRLKPDFMRNAILKDPTWEAHLKALRAFLDEELARALAKKEGLYEKMKDAFPRKMQDLLLESEQIRRTTGSKVLYSTSKGSRSLEHIAEDMSAHGKVTVSLPLHRHSLTNLVLHENQIDYVQLDGLSDLKVFATQLNDYHVGVAVSSDTLASFIMGKRSKRLPNISTYLEMLGLDHVFATFGPSHIPTIMLQFEAVKVLVINNQCAQILQLENCRNRRVFEYVLTDLTTTAILMGELQTELNEKQELLRYKVSALEQLLNHE